MAWEVNSAGEGSFFASKKDIPVYNRRAMNDTPISNYDRRCPSCGTNLKPGDKFCPLCGSPVEEEKTAKRPGYCPKCGFYKDDINAPCPHCGFSPNQSSGYSNYQSPAGKQVYGNADPDANKAIKGGFLGFLMAFFLGVLGLILCLIFGDKACRKGCVITFIVVFVVEMILLTILLSSGALSAIFYY